MTLYSILFCIALLVFIFGCVLWSIIPICKFERYMFLLFSGAVIIVISVIIAFFGAIDLINIYF